MLRSGQLGKDQSDHECLNETSDDTLKGHRDHGGDAKIRCLSTSVSDGVLQSSEPFMLSTSCVAEIS